MDDTTQESALGTTTRRSDTRAIGIPAPASEVFAFIADPENLPRWAVGFCRSIRRDDSAADRWIASTPQGDVAIRYVADQALGVIDFYFSPAANVETAAFSRVLPNAAGAEYVFTQFQETGMTDHVFDAQVLALREELQVLRSLFAARAVCPLCDVPPREPISNVGAASRDEPFVECPAQPNRRAKSRLRCVRRRPTRRARRPAFGKPRSGASRRGSKDRLHASDASLSRS
jgi:hypothetical protein